MWPLPGADSPLIFSPFHLYVSHPVVFVTILHGVPTCVGTLRTAMHVPDCSLDPYAGAGHVSTCTETHPFCIMARLTLRRLGGPRYFLSAV